MVRLCSRPAARRVSHATRLRRAIASMATLAPTTITISPVVGNRGFP